MARARIHRVLLLKFAKKVGGGDSSPESHGMDNEGFGGVGGGMCVRGFVVHARRGGGGDPIFSRAGTPRDGCRRRRGNRRRWSDRKSVV